MMRTLRRRFGFFLALLTVAAVALAAPLPLPRIGPIYSCNNAGGWQNVQFTRLTPYGNLYRGIMELNGDNKKADLAFDPSKNPDGWEFVMPLDNFSCRDLRVYQRRRVLVFNQCRDGINRVCWM